MDIRFRRSAWFVVVLMAILVALACSRKDNAGKERASDDAAPVEPEAPPIVVAMIDAHGGMAGWRSAKTLSFENEFRMADDSVATPSRVTVDLARRRAYVDIAGNGGSAVWDGRQTWSTHWTQPYPAGLRAVLDCYAINLPWLAMDPSTKLTVADRDTLWDGSTQYHVVRMILRPAAPGSPYRLYIDPETKRLHACAYNAASGEEVVVFGDQATVEGMRLPSHYVVYNADHTPLASGTLGDWATGRPFDENKMTKPDSAAVDQTTP